MGLVVLTSQEEAICKLRGVFGYYHSGLECPGKKQNIRRALKVERDSGYLFRNKMNTIGTRNGTSTGKRVEGMYQVWLQ